MKRAFVSAAIISALSFTAASSAARPLPPPALLERLARANLVVEPARPTDRPRVSLKQALMASQRAGFGLRKPYLVYALRLTKTDWTNHGRAVVDHRLVWLFVLPQVANPITGGNCQSDCEFSADTADVVDGTSGRWLFAQTLQP